MTEGATSELQNVCVAVKIRPLVVAERDDGCQECLLVTPGLPQVSAGQHTFTYDYVFGEGGASPDSLYSKCVAPLVAGLFKGYNATVFAYGQTGSGKTFTMGSEYRPGGRCRGVIPDAINDIFTRIETAKDAAITVRVSFVEIHKEEVKDLLLPATSGARPAVTIRETPNGDVSLYGAVEKEVRTREEMADVLELGALCRSTASTSMNNRSSRSHAIFTITIEQRREVELANSTSAQCEGAEEDGEDEDDAGAEAEGDGLEDFLGAKLHLVDLAGSERAKRTKAEGARLREGIHINRGLLALGNVINAIVDNHKHVPYRDSKLTRLLQDSLGGNSRTVMIACVSPADSNYEESLNTLRYADRARHIRNKPVVNRDPAAAQLAVLRNTIAQLKTENLSLRRTLAASGQGGGIPGIGFGGSPLGEHLERLTHENNSLQAENFQLKLEMDGLRKSVAEMKEKYYEAQAKYDTLRMNQVAAARREASQNGSGVNSTADGAGDAGASADSDEPPMPGLDIVKGYIGRIAELEAEVKSLKSLASHMPLLKRREPHTPGRPSIGQGVKEEGGGDDDLADDDPEDPIEAEYYMEMAARQLNQDSLQEQFSHLQKVLEDKERKMQQLMKGFVNAPAPQQYERAMLDLQRERDRLRAERKALEEKLKALAHHNEEERKRQETHYREKLQRADEQLKDCSQKLKDASKLVKLHQRAEEAKQKLSAEITQLKAQKVQLHRQLEANAKQNAAWKQEKDKEIQQLRRRDRKAQAKIQQLEAVQAKQSAVIQRKISDGIAARKRIKELSDAKKGRNTGLALMVSQRQAADATAAHTAMGGAVEIQPNAQAPVLRTEEERRKWLYKELELCDASSEFRKAVEGEIAERAEASRTLKELEKCLTHLEQLLPTSPLLVSGGAMCPITPSTAAAANALCLGDLSGPEGRQALLRRKKELEDKVAHHNAQIAELQAEWERQRLEEEQRGSASMDVRRFAGLRNVVECRELLRTLFRISLEAKLHCEEYFFDLGRLQEETALLRVQLDGACKKSMQCRRIALAYQATAAAARARATPRHKMESAPDETDKQVDAVLEDFKLLTPPNTSSAGGMAPASKVGEPPQVTEETAVEASTCVTGDADGDVEMEDAEAAPPESKVAKALDFLSPVPSGAHARMRRSEAAAQRYSPDHEASGEENEGPCVLRRPFDNTAPSHGKPVDFSPMAISDNGDETGSVSDDVYTDSEESDDDDDEEEEDESSESDVEEDGDGDDENDRDWNPEAATPFIKGRRGQGSRRSSALATSADDARSRRSGRSASPDEEDDELAELVADESTGKRRAKGGTNKQKRVSSRRTSCADPDVAELEHDVLNAINLNRVMAGQPRAVKLTVAVLKEALKGKTIDGKAWTAYCKGVSKTRADLVNDYGRLLGKCRSADAVQPPSQEPGTSSATAAADIFDKVLPINAPVASSASGECTVGSGEEPAAELTSPAAGTANAEGFSFSPHIARTALENATSTTVAPPVSAAQATATILSPTASSRRLNAAVSLQPWGRASVAAGNSSRHNNSWVDSLRAPSAAADAALAENGTAGALLSRSNSLVSNSSGRVASATTSVPVPDAGAVSSRRPLGWGSTSNGQVPAAAGPSRGNMGSRGSLASPRQSASPRLPGQSAQTATGATSPRSSLGSPTLRNSMHYPTKSPGAGAASPGESLGSRDRHYIGGENMQPGSSTPTGTTAGGFGAGKSTPLSNMMREKALEQRQRTSEARNKANYLRASMQVNWERYESANGGSGSGGVRASTNSLGVPLGAMASSNEGPSRVGGGLRDSYGSGLGINKQAKAVWR